jgi:hypothetical protein
MSESFQDKEQLRIDGSPITLAVVLRTIKPFVTNTQHDNHALEQLVDGIWNLEHDNYDQQSEECKQFIGSLLGV